MPTVFNPDGFVPQNTNELDKTEGVNEHIDTELKNVFSYIKRGDVSKFFAILCYCLGIFYDFTLLF